MANGNKNCYFQQGPQSPSGGLPSSRNTKCIEVKAAV